MTTTVPKTSTAIPAPSDPFNVPPIVVSGSSAPMFVIQLVNYDIF